MLEGTTPRTGGPYGVNHELCKEDRLKKRNTEGKMVIVLVDTKVLNQVVIEAMGRNQQTTSGYSDSKQYILGLGDKLKLTLNFCLSCFLQ